MNQWADALPPFVEGSVLVAPGGSIWVERLTPSGTPFQVDVFSRLGGLEARILAPEGRRLVAVGQSRVYLVRTDAVGREYLEVYLVPSGL